MKRIVNHALFNVAIALCVTALVLSAACRENTEEDSDVSAAASWIEGYDSEGFPIVNPLEVRGNVVTAGSSTVGPLATYIVEVFQEDGYAGQISVDVIGSGAGFERFTVAGESDVSNASRAIKQSEIAAAAEIGRLPIPFRVGSDALSIAVSSENDFVNSVSAEEAAALFGSAELWSDVNPAWPSEEILRYVPGTDSGTFDFFVELIFDEDPTVILSAGNTQFSEDDNVLVRGISGSPYAVGFFGFAYYLENADLLTVLSIEGISPSVETVARAQSDSVAGNVALGGYPLSRPLFIYSDAGIMQEKPQVAAYIAYFLNTVDEVIGEVGYFSADLGAAKENWLLAVEEADWMK